MADQVICPICKTKARPLDKVGDFEGFECRNDCRFRVTRSVFDTPALRDAPRQKWRTRQASEGPTTGCVGSHNRDPRLLLALHSMAQPR